MQNKCMVREGRPVFTSRGRVCRWKHKESVWDAGSAIFLDPGVGYPKGLMELT